MRLARFGSLAICVITSCLNGQESDLPVDLSGLIVFDRPTGRTSAGRKSGQFEVYRHRFESRDQLMVDHASAPDGHATYVNQMGYARLLAQSIDGAFEPFVQGLIGTAKVQAVQADTITIIPPRQSMVGKPGRFLAKLRVSGHAGIEEPDEIHSTTYLLKSHYDLSFSAAKLGMSGSWEHSRLVRKEVELAAPKPRSARGYVDFTFGEPFRLELNLSGNTQAHAGRATNGPIRAFLDVEYTWGGISQLTDWRGRRIRHLEVDSASGFDWSKPGSAPSVSIPEPGGALVVIAMTGLILNRRRSSARSGHHR